MHYGLFEMVHSRILNFAPSEDQFFCSYDYEPPVDQHPMGCHARCTRHSQILYFAPLEDQIFA